MSKFYKFMEGHPTFILSVATLLCSFIVGISVLKYQVNDQRVYLEQKIDSVNDNLNDKILQADRQIDENFQTLIGLMKQTNQRLDQLIVNSNQRNYK